MLWRHSPGFLDNSREKKGYENTADPGGYPAMIKKKGEEGWEEGQGVVLVLPFAAPFLLLGLRTRSPGPGQYSGCLTSPCREKEQPDSSDPLYCPTSGW